MNAPIPTPRPRPDAETVATVTRALGQRFGDRAVTGQAVREQHASTLTWVPNQPPDVVVYAHSTEEVQEIVRLCAAHRMPVVAFGTGTSLEGHVNAPYGGVSIDMMSMNRVLAVHAEDLDCVVQPGITRKALNEHLRDQGLFFRSIRVPTPPSAAWRRPAPRAPTRSGTAR